MVRLGLIFSCGINGNVPVFASDGFEVRFFFAKRKEVLRNEATLTAVV